MASRRYVFECERKRKSDYETIEKYDHIHPINKSILHFLERLRGSRLCD